MRETTPRERGGCGASRRSRHDSFVLSRLRDAALQPTILIADLIGLAAAAAITLALHSTVTWSALALSGLLCAVTCLALSLRAGLYRRMVVRSAWLDAPCIASMMLQGGGLVLPFSAIAGADIEQLSLLGTLVLLGIPCRVALRSLSQPLVRYLGAGSTSRLLIIGAGHVGQCLAALLIKYRQPDITVVGFVDEHEHGAGHRRVLALPVYRGKDLEHVLETQCVDHVVFSFSRLPDSEAVMLLRICQQRVGIQISLVPRLFEVMPARTRLLDVHGIPLVQFDTPGRLALSAKRAVDLVAASIGLVLTAPLMLLAAIAIRLEGPGPILFRQTRIGRGGTPFTMYKLRSMRERFAGEDAAAAARQTRVGRILRESGIDELPQLWNVLRGEMSLVGPRPEQPAYVDMCSERIPRYQERHRMRGGITGLAQVNGLRGDTSFVERTRLDNVYIDTWSLWLDVRIVLLTFAALIPSSQGIGGEAMFRDVVTDVVQNASGMLPNARTAQTSRASESTHPGSAAKTIEARAR